MAIRMIIKDPDPILREKSKPVNKITPNIHKLLDNMADTMYDAHGVGLAAPQIGILKRVIIVDVGGEEESQLYELINPEIVSGDGEQLGPEGCLSIPGLQGDVKRLEHIVIKGLNRDGEEVTIEAEGYLARAFQHEVDHLNGILFTDIAESVYERELITNDDEDE